MGYLPLFLDVTGRACVVIGGGAVAERKLCSLIEAGAFVTIISPETTAAIAHEIELGRAWHIRRKYQPGDLRGFMLAFVATNDESANRMAAAEAHTLGIPVNVADMPELCTFIAPSVLKRGDLQVAISTSGASPAVAKMLREELEERIGPEYEILLEVMRAVRKYLQNTDAKPRSRARVLVAIAAPLRECLERKDYAAADTVVKSNLGVHLADLGIEFASHTGPGVHSSPE